MAGVARTRRGPKGQGRPDAASQVDQARREAQAEEQTRMVRAHPCVGPSYTRAFRGLCSARWALAQPVSRVLFCCFSILTTLPLLSHTHTHTHTPHPTPLLSDWSPLALQAGPRAKGQGVTGPAPEEAHREHQGAQPVQEGRRGRQEQEEPPRIRGHQAPLPRKVSPFRFQNTGHSVLGPVQC